MVIAENHPPHSLGLGGDGDEVVAIKDVEDCFGVRLDYADAGDWRTVGHVFAALSRMLPAESAAAPETWKRFATAISRETGVNPTQVTRDTLLLGQHRFKPTFLILAAILIGLAFVAIQNW